MTGWLEGDRVELEPDREEVVAEPRLGDDDDDDAAEQEPEEDGGTD